MPFSKIIKDPLYSPDCVDVPIAAYNNLSSFASSNLGSRKSTSVPSHRASTAQSDPHNDFTKTPPRKGSASDNSTPFRPEKVGSAPNAQPLSEQLLSHFHPLSELLSELSTGDKANGMV